MLICEYAMHPLFIPGEFAYSRDAIRDVRVEKSDEANAAAGTLIGAGSLAALGAIAPDNGALTRGGRALLGGLIGGVIGNSFGRSFHVLPGHLV